MDKSLKSPISFGYIERDSPTYSVVSQALAKIGWDKENIDPYIQRYNLSVRKRFFFNKFTFRTTFIPTCIVALWSSCLYADVLFAKRNVCLEGANNLMRVALVGGAVSGGIAYMRKRIHRREKHLYDIICTSQTMAEGTTLSEIGLDTLIRKEPWFYP